MANLIRRHEGQQTSSAIDPYRAFFTDPWRTMRDLLGIDPFSMLAGRGMPGEQMFVPDIEIRETKDALVLKADLPGVKEQDVEVDLTGNRLTISGKREEEQERREGERYYAYERSFGSFQRSVTLPEGVDTENVSADLKNGVLEVTIPKRPEVKPRRISVKGEQGAGAGGAQASAQPQQKPAEPAAAQKQEKQEKQSGGGKGPEAQRPEARQ